MADFCLDCARRLGFPKPDIKADPGSTTWDICEGCGPDWFDEQGKRAMKYFVMRTISESNETETKS